MARPSKHDHVKKICDCAKWKECAHPWYVDYRKGEGKGAPVLRKKLAPLVGREPKDFADAKLETRRAIVAWEDGLDATQLIPGDTPTVAKVLDDYGARPNGTPIDRYQRGPMVTTKVNGRPFGEWLAADVTRDMVEAFRRQRPRVAGNRDLAVLRAAFNWAVLGGLIPATPFKVGTVSAVKLAREEPRTRRLQPGEEERLLPVSNRSAEHRKRVRVVSQDQSRGPRRRRASSSPEWTSTRRPSQCRHRRRKRIGPAPSGSDRVAPWCRCWRGTLHGGGDRSRRNMSRRRVLARDRIGGRGRRRTRRRSWFCDLTMMTKPCDESSHTAGLVQNAALKRRPSLDLQDARR